MKIFQQFRVYSFIKFVKHQITDIARWMDYYVFDKFLCYSLFCPIKISLYINKFSTLLKGIIFAQCRPYFFHLSVSNRTYRDANNSYFDNIMRSIIESN